MKDVHFNGYSSERKYYSSDATVSEGDPEWLGSSYRAAQLPLQEKLLHWTDKILALGELEHRYRSHSDMGYWPGELVYYFIPLFIAILSIYFFHKKQAENQKMKTLVDEMRGAGWSAMCVWPYQDKAQSLVQFPYCCICGR